MVAWNPQQPNIISAVYGDNYIRTWDVSTKKCLHKVKPSTKKPILSITWSCDGKLIGVGSDDDSLIVIDFESGKELGKQLFSPSQLDEFQCSANPDFVFTATHKRGKGVLTCSKLTSKPQLRFEAVASVAAYAGSCLAFVTDARRKRLALSADDSVVSIWNTKDLINTATLDYFDFAPTVLCFSPDGRYLASAFVYKGTTEGAYLDIADASTGQRLSIIKVKEREIYNISWHPSKPVIAFCGKSNVITAVAFS